MFACSGRRAKVMREGQAARARARALVALSLSAFRAQMGVAFFSLGYLILTRVQTITMRFKDLCKKIVSVQCYNKLQKSQPCFFYRLLNFSISRGIATLLHLPFS